MPNGLSSLKELLGRRTPGEWQALDDGVCLAYGGDWIATTEPDGRIARYEAEANAVAIAALSNAADELVAVAQAAQAWLTADQEYHDSGGDSEWMEARDGLKGALSALNDALEGEGRRD